MSGSDDKPGGAASIEDVERFFNLSLDMLCVAGTDAFFRRINPAFEAVLGYTEKELLERPFLDFVHPADVEKTEAAVDRLDAGENVIDFENRYRCKDGTYRRLSWRAKTDQENGLIHAIARDVTVQRDLESQLRQSQKMDAIGQLASGVAHDFNNLILAIQANAQFASQEEDEEKRLYYLDQVQSASERAAKLTQQLLAFGRQSRVRSSSLDFNQVVRDVLALIAPLIGANIEVELAFGDALPRVDADAIQLEQLIMNLCVNARDAMPNGGKLSVETSVVLVGDESPGPDVRLEKGRYARLSVADNGIGMEPEVRERIFEPFFTTKETGKGNGLGLATVYTIATQHGAVIRNVSEVGRGTTFHVFFPEGVTRPSAKMAARLGPASSGTETILVAEDEAAVRRVIVSTLERAGYEVVTANDGAEAVERFENHRGKIQLLLFDVIMPRLSGPDAFEVIHALEPDIPVLFSSGYAPDGLALGADESCTWGLLQKPYAPADLLSRVRSLLDGK